MLAIDQKAHLVKLIEDADLRTRFYFKNKKLKSELRYVCQPMCFDDDLSYTLDQPSEILGNVERIFEAHKTKAFSEQEQDKLHEQIKAFYQERLYEIVDEVLTVPPHLI